MAFTKITGPGIHTLTNIVSHNVKSSGIITAVNENLNGWLAVGSTASFGGNVSIGGTLTYDDVTNVESVGIITAKGGLHVGAGGTIIHALSEDDGRVGIGTDDPIYRLQVLEDGGLTSTIGSASTIVRFTNKSGTGNNGDLNLTIYDKKISLVGTENWRGTEKRIEYNVDDNAVKRMWIGFLNETTTTSDNIIRFGEAYDTEWMRIDNGRVGIGTTNPTRNLQIGGLSVDSYNAIRFGRRIASQNTNLPLIGHHSGDGTGSGLALCATSTNGAIHFFTGNGGNGFGANDNQERVVIKHDGKVGIGTTTPQEKLHIHEGDIVIGQDSGSNTDIRNYIKFGRVDAPKAAIGFINTTGNGRGDILFMNSDVSNTSEFTNSDEVVRITHEGKVGIGTITPSTIVDVDGDITIRNGTLIFNTAPSGTNDVAETIRIDDQGGTGDRLSLIHI